jgi:hypothetical protein
VKKIPSAISEVETIEEACECEPAESHRETIELAAL